MSLYTILSFYVAYQRTKLHLKLDNRRRVPLMVIMSWGSTLVVLLFLVLPFVGANAKNGGTLVLFLFECVFFNLKSMFLLRKLIKLGRVIIPLSAKLVPVDDEEADEAVLDLSRINKVLSFMFIACSMIVAGQILCLLILQFVGVAELDKNKLVRTTWGLEAFIIALIYAALLYQLQRCINAIRPKDVTGLNPDQIFKLQYVTRKMQYQQVVSMLTGTPSVVFYLLLAVSIIPLHYSILILAMWLDITANFFMVRSQLKKSSKQRNEVTAGALLTARSTPIPRTPILDEKSIKVPVDGGGKVEQ
jgi:hypothetical protein